MVNAGLDGETYMAGNVWILGVGWGGDDVLPFWGLIRNNCRYNVILFGPNASSLHTIMLHYLWPLRTILLCWFLIDISSLPHQMLGHPTRRSSAIIMFDAH